MDPTDLRFGRYRISAKLGEGGMAQVYRATDTQLQRDVALKMLPLDRTPDPDQVMRFKREARLLAALNHPHIAQIFDLVQEGKQYGLALELVEGETLSERIRRGTIPLAEALPIALQLALALEAAHQSGIIHRDLKPANIKITSEGVAKVLDFGLGKLLESPAASDAVDEESTHSGDTRTGAWLGTVGYMSPEQARARGVDSRTDVWAFGAVLFEMLTGAAAFPGATISDRIAAVLERNPDWDQLPKDTPLWVRGLLHRCLLKDPRKRLQAIGEARILLEDAGLDSTSTAPAGKLPRSKLLPWLVVAALAALALAFVSGRWMSAAGEHAEIPHRVFRAVDADGITTAKISPDGRRIAYIEPAQRARGDGSGGGRQLWVRDFDSLTPRVLVEASDLTDIFWSPDSAAVAAVGRNRLFVVPAAGGPSRELASFKGHVVGRLWRPGEILLSLAGPEDQRGVFRIPESGGELELFLSPDRAAGEFDFHDLATLPEGDQLLIRMHMTSGSDRIALQNGPRRDYVLALPGRTLGEGIGYSRVTGHILYTQTQPNPGIWAAPFDKGKVTGEPVRLVEHASDLSLAEDDTLLYLSGASVKGYQLFWFDRAGVAGAPLGNLASQIRTPVLSPDGDWVAVSANGQLALHSTQRGTVTPLSATPSRHFGPAWSPDGTRLVFTCTVSTEGRSSLNLCLRSADGRGPVQQLLEQGDALQPDWSQDGKSIVYVLRTDSGGDIWYLRPDDPAKTFPFIVGGGDESNPKLSPNGKYLAYASDEGGRPEVYVQPFPEGEGRWQVSVEGGSHPLWSPKGDELFYVEGVSGAATLKVVPVRTESRFEAESPQTLFTDLEVEAPLLIFSEYAYAVAPDGRLILVRSVRQGDPIVTVVQNWAKALQR